ncbi:MAG: EAL domain-containing protein [Methylicorpusculum sp.]|uniref:EAL domain-containing protein n=1 Tax=Methylicorpusculum sp. TaxID=2713644 RepID=UPI002723742C|nr:EAL domain-containing protein [Methylicorpusculum sp.]MDO8938336.1 EAL domain-containing protein [Methylicorpusculum sp.]MDP2200401.1 EAL domain-containing protein [Methylicorpusculum sp.]
METSFFLSLRWKLALLFGGIFILLNCLFAYFAYSDAKQGFSEERMLLRNKQDNLAKMLSEDSFQNLEQLAELFVLNAQEFNHNSDQKMLSVFDRNWEQWEFIWGLENITVFDATGLKIKSRGRKINTDRALIDQMLQSESPVHTIICSQTSCYQQVIVPVMGKGTLVGAFSMARTFADTVIKFKEATRVDVGVLMDSPKKLTNGWPYALSAKTFAGLDFDLFAYLTERYTFEQLLNKSGTLTVNDQVYEVRIRPLRLDSSTQAPFLLIAEEITGNIRLLDIQLEKVWIQGVMSLLCSLAVLVLVSWFFLRRIAHLAKALPLLATHEYNQFRKELVQKKWLSLGFDEVDKLNDTVLTLALQLENLEHIVRKNTLQILEKSQELASERDSIQELVNSAPVIMLTQKVNGQILTINQEGVKVFGEEKNKVIGRLFDLYLPPAEAHHLNQLDQLRLSKSTHPVQIEGGFISSTGSFLHVFWIHTLFNSNRQGSEPIVLSLGMDISAEKQTEQKMLKMASFDPATGLGNRQRFQRELPQALNIAKRYGHAVALLYFDLQHLDLAQEAVAQAVDKRVMVKVASHLKQFMRETDLLCRIGESQLVLILPDAQTQGVVSLAQKMIKRISSLKLILGSQYGEIATNIGIAFYPLHADSPDHLVANAERAMNYAKLNGKNFYYVYEQTLTNKYEANLNQNTIRQIQQLLENDDGVLSFTPVFDVHLRQVGFYQCSICLASPNGDIPLSREYGQVIEQLELAEQLDRVSIVRAFEIIAKMKRSNKKVKLSLALSGSSVTQVDSIELIGSLLKNYQIDPRQIIFDLNERYVLGHLTQSHNFINEIKLLGCEFCLSDFGVEFSSFFYLKQLPIDYVRIDGSFIKRMDQHKEDNMYVRALVDVIHAFGKKVIVDDVESDRVLALVEQMGVEYARGSFFDERVDNQSASLSFSSPLTL